jgi:hypothetical protein
MALAILFLAAVVLEATFPQFFTWLSGGRNKQHQPAERPIPMEFLNRDQSAELR